MPESFESGCGCTININAQAPTIAPYVVSIAGLNGIISLDGTGVLDISTSGNTIVFGLAPGAGLGTVTSVNASSSNSNLTVAGGPITTNGTFTFNLAGALASISGLVTAADKMIYTTALDTYAVTDLTAFARTILDDANAGAVRTTLGLVIGTNVQAFSQDLTDFVTNAVWTGADLNITSGTLSAGAFSGNNIDLIGDADFGTTGSITNAVNGTFSGTVTATTLTGALNMANANAGTLAVARGGTGLASYAIGDIIYASGATTLAKLAAGISGAYLRFTGAGSAPIVSTLMLPNAANTGDVFYGTGANTMGRLSISASGNVLLSSGATPQWGKVTSSHVDSTIPTMSGGVNSDLSSFFLPITFSDVVTITSDLHVSGGFYDSTDVIGSPGNVLTSTGSGTEWSTGITVNTLVLNTNFGLEGTITGAGTTGNQTINKPCGTVRFAAAASSLVVTNSLCTTSHRVLAMCCTNDTTATVKNVVTTTGSFTIVLEAAATAETEVYWELREIT